MFRIGIIGCGKIAQVRHIPEYAPITIAALKAGKHVLCEKPMATTLEECEEMVKTAHEAGKFLMIGHNQRLAKAHAVAKELIDQGMIGRIITFRTTFGHGGPETWSVDPGKNTWFFDKNKAAMGAMADLGIHKTDLIQFLTGQHVVRTTARVVTLDKKDASGQLIGVDDNAICIYEMSGGTMGTMTASWTYYGAEDNSTILYGEKGIMRIYDDPAHSIVVKLADGTEKVYDVEQIRRDRPVDELSGDQHSAGDFRRGSPVRHARRVCLSGIRQGRHRGRHS